MITNSIFGRPAHTGALGGGSVSPRDRECAQGGEDGCLELLVSLNGVDELVEGHCAIGVGRGDSIA